jgi:hypothetical protein
LKYNLQHFQLCIVHCKVYILCTIENLVDYNQMHSQTWQSTNIVQRKVTIIQKVFVIVAKKKQFCIYWYLVFFSFSKTYLDYFKNILNNMGELIVSLESLYLDVKKINCRVFNKFHFNFNSKTYLSI